MMAKTSAKKCAARYELYSTFAFHFYLLLFYRFPSPSFWLLDLVSSISCRTIFDVTVSLKTNDLMENARQKRRSEADIEKLNI